MEDRGGAGPGGNLERALGDLRALSGEIESCAVLTEGGELLASSHPSGADRERSATMLAAVMNAARRLARREGKEDVSQLRVDTEDGHLLLVRLDGGALAATTGADARVGLVLYDMRNARGEIGKALKGEVGS